MFEFSAPSFYPGRGNNDHPFARIESRTQESGLNNDDSNAETDEDLDDESHLAELAQGPPGKFSEAMVIERPSWQAVSSDSLPTLTEERSGGAFIANAVDMPLACGSMVLHPAVRKGQTLAIRGSGA
ncbi:hypothetical protein BC827DRAFT_1274922 [Russula dissimulans]|nr:hypothetical protein BC827DRAFT_1274922 [Russula dissimulans]